MNTLGKKYNCNCCDYSCVKLSDWTKHTSTRKHLSRVSIEHKNSPVVYFCNNCNKEYKVRSSLWYHEKKCMKSQNIGPATFSVQSIEPKNSPDQYLSLINHLLADNKELRNFIIEQSKTSAENMNNAFEHNAELMNKTIECCKISSNNTTINGNVNNNNKFNINMFLNEQCKNAWNFNDFINKIQISYADLENNAQLGFVAGISKIFLDNLKLLDINQRPIHCTDIKRETMYIKDEDKWNKESDDTKLQKAIQTVSYKSIGKLMEWKQENPDYQNMDSEFSKRCLDMQRQTLAGSDRDVYYPKVIHVLAKETMVDK
jgi:hypothetical protein